MGVGGKARCTALGCHPRGPSACAEELQVQHMGLWSRPWVTAGPGGGHGHDPPAPLLRRPAGGTVWGCTGRPNVKVLGSPQVTRPAAVCGATGAAMVPTGGPRTTPTCQPALLPAGPSGTFACPGPDGERLRLCRPRGPHASCSPCGPGWEETCCHVKPFHPQQCARVSLQTPARAPSLQPLPPARAPRWPRPAPRARGYGTETRGPWLGRGGRRAACFRAAAFCPLGLIGRS
ncbi:uncharacterized protein LOC119518285 [Choloepus didactylus]|uniref:uncharacterized protein LOC119518285 n=1 Tax=Choloepus didactylus TaxID=27675 RepID=UPI00189F0A47|nr:uncharacterized protein LOC119518285 [Choloepus didactylus]